MANAKLSYKKKKKIEIILQNYIFKYINMDKLLKYNIFVNWFMYKIIVYKLCYA